MNNPYLKDKTDKIFKIIELEKLIRDLTIEEGDATSVNEKMDIWNDKILARKEKIDLAKEFSNDELKRILDAIPEDYVIILSYVAQYREEKLMSLLRYYYEKLLSKAKVM